MSTEIAAARARLAAARLELKAAKQALADLLPAIGERDAEIERLWRVGGTYDTIAVRLDLTRSVVAGVCFRRGLRAGAR